MKWLSVAASVMLSSCGTPAFAADLPTIEQISCKRVREYVAWYGAAAVFDAVRARGVDEGTIQRKATSCRIPVPPRADPWR